MTSREQEAVNHAIMAIAPDRLRDFAKSLCDKGISLQEAREALVARYYGKSVEWAKQHLAEVHAKRSEPATVPAKQIPNADGKPTPLTEAQQEAIRAEGILHGQEEYAEQLIAANMPVPLAKQCLSRSRRPINEVSGADLCASIGGVA